MPFRRRGLNPIKSEKEEVTFSALAENASAVKTINIALATNDPSTAGQVEIGDTIKSIFFEVNFSAETITNTKIVHWIIFKNEASVFSNTPSVQDTTTKRFVFKRGMEMLPKDVSTVIKRIGVVAIPKGKQRMGDTDAWQFKYVVTSAETVNTCGNFIFRHFG